LTSQSGPSILGVAGELLHLADEMRVDLPVRPVVPGDMQSTGRMADEKEFHLAAAIDEQGFRIVVQELGGFFGGQVFHVSLRAKWSGTIKPNGR